MPIQLQIRRGLASQWLDANTTLNSGEIGYETDTGFFKIGTGNTAWANLKYTISNTALFANNASYLNGNSALTLRTYTEDKASNAYSNSVTYIDTRIGVVNTAIVANAAAAYNNAAADSTAKATAAIIYADYVLGVANAAIIANSTTTYTNATTFSANATNLTNGTIPYGRFPVNIINTTADFTRAGVTTFNANLVVNTNAGISANGTYGTQGQALLSNGSSVYWATATAGSNTYIQFNDSGAANASAGFTFNKTTNTVSFGNSTVNASINSTAYTGSASFVGGNTAATLRSYSDTTSATAYSNAVTYVDTRIGVVNTAITSNAATAYTDSVSYTDGKIATANTAMAANASAAYSNAVSYIDTKIGTANVAITGNAAAAYANSVTYTDGKILTANAAITGNAATAYANSVTYVDTRIGVVNTAITGNAATAYSNGVTYTDTRIGVVNNAITGNATTTYSNAVSYVDNKLYVNTSQLSSNLSLYGTLSGEATRVAGMTANNTSFVGTVSAANVVSNSQLSSNLSNYQTTAGLSANVATLSANNSTYLNGQLAAYYTNATNISTGTIAEARLPYRLNQNLTTTNNVTFANISLTGGTISTAPVNASDIVNKQYADAIATGVNFHPAVRLSTTVTFDATTATYNNGTNGVNATITDNSPYVAISLDGVAAAYGDRVLMRTVSNTVWNGIYVVSNTGSASYPWILTRAYDYDQVGSGVNEIDKGDLIYVLAGTTLAGTAWVQQNDITTIGTDGISFVQFSSKALYPLTEGAGLYYSVGGAYDGSAASTLAVNTTYIATLSSNNAAYLGGVAAASYVNTSGAFTRTGVTTFNANVVIGTAGISVNSSFGTAGQVLTSNGTTAYWAATGAGSFTNGQSISVANLVITGSVTANSSNGTAGQVLTSNSTGVYWAAPAASVTAANATSESFTGNGSNTVFTLTNSVANQRNVIVSMNGLLQVPVTHYTISGTTLTFTDAPYIGAVIEARSIEGVALVSGGGSGGGGGLSWQSVQTANFTAVSGYAYPVNTTSGVVTVTLPASPSLGNIIQVSDYAGTFGTNVLVISPNGGKINSSTNSIVLSNNRETVTLCYVDATQGWLIAGGINTDSYTMSYLVVAGGGGGGSDLGGGGGAGGLLTGSAKLVIGSTVTVTVGGGGAGRNAGAGSSIASTLANISAVGGAAGSDLRSNGKSGGCGSGAGGDYGNYSAFSGGSGTSGQGKNGGGAERSSINATGGGGGGGAGTDGATSLTSNGYGGAGGSGVASSITGTSVTYAGGGGGGHAVNGGSNGGSGGGGTGGNSGGGAGGTGTTNLGGGGGGGGGNFGGGNSGGSGVVIIALPTSNYTGATTGSPTITTNGVYTILKFTSSGTYTA